MPWLDYALADKKDAANRQVQPYVSVHLPSAGDPRVAIFDEEPFLGLHMNGLRSPILKRSLPSVRREVKIDSTGKNINFIEKMDKFDFRLPTYLTLTDYIAIRSRRNQQDMWVRHALSKLGENTSGSSRGGAIRIDIPVEIKNRAFQAIFGGGTVGLDVTGEINIKGGLRHENRSEQKTSLAQGNDTNFKMEQTQRFQVQGHVGEKVTIGVDQDSERTFDFDNNLHLRYQGYEDEIVQSIEAGNIALSLPGTRFVTFGGQSSGLFGIKAAMNLGNLKLTAIASQEKGENKKLSVSGGATDNNKTVEDYNYVKDQYYFLDEHYRNWFSQRDNNGKFLTDPNHPPLTNIEVYTSQPSYSQLPNETIYGWAWSVAPGDTNVRQIISRTDTTVKKGMYRGFFKRMEKTSYTFDPDLGFIRLNLPLTTGQVLAVAYKDSLPGGYVRGMIDYNPIKDRIIQLRMLRPENPLPSDDTWDLEWKNVYNLGGRSIPDDGFELKIFYKPPSGDAQETIDINGQVKSFLQIFGLDNVNATGASIPDNIVDRNDNVLRLASGELWFPDLRPFDPIAVGLELPDDKRSPAIYDTTVQSVINAESKFYIQIISKMRDTEYNLGMNVIENSEEVTLNGRRLNRGTDYTIDYFTGTLRMLNDEASRPTANVDVTYESNQMFQIEKKTVMGARAEYGLWDDSFIGGTFLYQSERTIEQKVRVGKGPMKNMVWDVNTSLNANPFFLTRFANLLPFVDTREPSRIRFEGELAQVLPNPNTSNGVVKDDKDGVAYIDDFEPAKRMTPLGISRRSWNLCSTPVDKIIYRPGASNIVDLSERGELLWWEPFGQWPIQDVWPNRDVTGATGSVSTTSILKIRFNPPDSLADKTKAWGGIQKWLPQGYWNQTESKFLEIWVSGESGVMHIDLGAISEDIIPNNQWDTEDQMRNKIRNTVLDDGEDVGLDGMADNDPRAIAAGGDFWDIDRNGKRDWGEPYSNDNYSYSEKSEDYSRINGTEGNENDYGGRKPDSEDMNNNSGVDLNNDYFEYTVPLDTTNALAKDIFVAPANKGQHGEVPGRYHAWKLYRIPLEGADLITKKVGTPSKEQIQYVRIWFDGMTKPGEIWIADINLVGNEWKELGVAPPQTPENYKVPEDKNKGVFATVMNTHENPDYAPPPGVMGEVDLYTNAVQREQSLVMQVKSLAPGENGILQKTFYEAQDYINYKTLKMFVGGDDNQHMIQEERSDIEFFFRFGADMNNYYEIREKVYPEWDARNEIKIDLVKLAALKAVIANYDSSGYRNGFQGVIDGKECFIKGTPALRNVRMLVIGVHNCGKKTFDGEIWINEVRLTNVKKEKGMAYRARLDLDWADLLKFNGEFSKQDADFHNVAQRFGDGDNTESGNFQTSINLDKFLPSQLGIAIPFSYNQSYARSLPKYVPGTDVETAALDNALKDQVRTLDDKNGFTVSFSVRSRSNNFIVKNILANLRANYSQSQGTASSSTIKESKNISRSGNLDWGVTFGANNYFRPFKFLGESALASRLSELKMYYTPTNFNAKISGTNTKSESETRTKLKSKNETFSFNSSLSSQLKLFESLSLDVNRSYVNDLNGFSPDTIRMMLNRGQLGLLTSMNQNFSARYNPRIFSWLTANGSYSANFRYGYNRQQYMRDVSLGKTYNLSGSFDLSALVKSVYRPSLGGAGGVRPGAGRGGDSRGAGRRDGPGAGTGGRQSDRGTKQPDAKAQAKEQAKKEKERKQLEIKLTQRLEQARADLADMAEKGVAVDSTALKNALADSVQLHNTGAIKTAEQLKKEQQQKQKDEQERLKREKQEKEARDKVEKEKAQQAARAKAQQAARDKGKEWLKQEKQLADRLRKLRQDLTKKAEKSVVVADSTALQAALADSIKWQQDKVAQQKEMSGRLQQARLHLKENLDTGAAPDSTALRTAMADSVKLFSEELEQKKQQSERLQQLRKDLFKNVNKGDVADSTAYKKALADSAKLAKDGPRPAAFLKQEQQVASRLARLRSTLEKQIRKGAPVDSTELRSALADSVLLQTTGKLKSSDQIKQETLIRTRPAQERQLILKAMAKGATPDSSQLRKALADSIELQTTGKYKSVLQLQQEKKAQERLLAARQELVKKLRKGIKPDSSEYRAALADSLVWHTIGVRTEEQIKVELQLREQSNRARKKVNERLFEVKLIRDKLAKAVADSAAMYARDNKPPDQLKMEQRIYSRMSQARAELVKQSKKKGAAVDSSKFQAAWADSGSWREGKLKTPERIKEEEKLTKNLLQLRKELLKKGAKADSAKYRLVLADSIRLATTGRVKTSDHLKKEKKLKDRLLAIRKALEKKEKKGKKIDLTELQAVMADSMQLEASGRIKTLEQIKREQKSRDRLTNLRKDLEKQRQSMVADSLQLKNATADSMAFRNNGTVPKAIAAKAAVKTSEEQKKKEQAAKDAKPKEPITVMGMVDKFFTIFEPLSVNYGKRETDNMFGITGMPTWKYQLGLSDSLSVPLATQSASGGGNVNRNSSSINNTLSLSTGLGISRDIKIQFKFDDNYTLNSGTTTTGQRSHSRLIYDAIDMPFPEWSIRISSLEKLPLINKVVQRISLDHNYSGQYDETFDKKSGQEVVDKYTCDSKFAPLAGVNLSFKNGMTVTMRYNSSKMETVTRSTGDGATKNEKSDFSLTANWSKRSDFRIPLPIWPFKNMRLKNSIDLSLSVAIGSDRTWKKVSDGGYESTNETTKWTFKPNLNYTFSDRVRGGMHLELGKNHHKLLGDTTFKEFGLEVNISIRGS